MEHIYILHIKTFKGGTGLDMDYVYQEHIYHTITYTLTNVYNEASLMIIFDSFYFQVVRHVINHVTSFCNDGRHFLKIPTFEGEFYRFVLFS